jgi:hypothetical protein
VYRGLCSVLPESAYNVHGDNVHDDAQSGNDHDDVEGGSNRKYIRKDSQSRCSLEGHNGWRLERWNRSMTGSFLVFVCGSQFVQFFFHVLLRLPQHVPEISLWRKACGCSSHRNCLIKGRFNCPYPS